MVSDFMLAVAAAAIGDWKSFLCCCCCCFGREEERGVEGEGLRLICLCLRGFLNFLSMDSYGYIIPLVYVGFSYN